MGGEGLGDDFGVVHDVVHRGAAEGEIRQLVATKLLACAQRGGFETAGFRRGVGVEVVFEAEG